MSHVHGTLRTFFHSNPMSRAQGTLARGGRDVRIRNTSAAKCSVIDASHTIIYYTILRYTTIIYYNALEAQSNLTRILWPPLEALQILMGYRTIPFPGVMGAPDRTPPNLEAPVPQILGGRSGTENLLDYSSWDKKCHTLGTSTLWAIAFLPHTLKTWPN